MNLRTKVLSCAGALIAAASLSVVPLAAQAEPPSEAISDTVNFTGTTTGLTCDPAAEGFHTCPAAPNNNGVPVIGGEGTYGFNTSAGSCDITSDLEAAATCSISSTGVYESVACGTGEASGSATLTVTGDPTEGGTISYNIDFVAGMGTFDPDNNEANGPPGDAAAAEEASGEVANSVTENESAGPLVTYAATLNPDKNHSNVTITPGNPGANGVCVTSFTVKGVAEINEDSSKP